MEKYLSAAAQFIINRVDHNIPGTLGDKNEMQCVQPNSQDSDITMLMKVLGASRAAAYQTVHTHSPTVGSFVLRPPSFLSFFMFLSKWLLSLFPLIPPLSESHRLSPG